MSHLACFMWQTCPGQHSICNSTTSQMLKWSAYPGPNTPASYTLLGGFMCPGHQAACFFPVAACTDAARGKKHMNRLRLELRAWPAATQGSQRDWHLTSAIPLLRCKCSQYMCQPLEIPQLMKTAPPLEKVGCVVIHGEFVNLNASTKSIAEHLLDSHSNDPC